MLISVDDGPAIVACNTCRHTKAAREDASGQRGGRRMVAALRSVQDRDERYRGIAVQEMSCLFACTEFCTVHVRAPGKVGYVLGRFTPDAASATAIFDYALLHAGSDHGKVPFKLWPEGIKGHFICRTPPAGFVVQ